MDFVNNVCRLCLSTNDLMSIFDSKINCLKKMKLEDVIFTITGVEIIAEGPLSQEICTQCYQATISMYHFRMKARKSSNILKMRYKQELKSSHISNSDETKEDAKSEMEIKEVHEPSSTIHPSVMEIFKTFPRLNLPVTLLKYNINPRVILERNTVDNFLKKKTKNQPICARLALLKASVEKNDTSAASITSDHLQMSSLSIINPDIRDNIIVNPKKRRFSGGDIFSDSETKNSSQRQNLNHLTCQFCRSMFKTINSKEAHIKNMCAIKNMMIHLPSVELKNIALDPKIRIKYPEAFIEQSLLSEPPLSSRISKESSEYGVIENKKVGHDEKDGCNGGSEFKIISGYNTDDDVIEILSDDDDSLPRKNDVSIYEEKIAAAPNIRQKTINSGIASTKSTAMEKVSCVTISLPSSTALPVNSAASPTYTLFRHPSSENVTPDIVEANKSSNKGGLVKDGISVTSKSLSTLEVTSDGRKTTIYHQFNPSFTAGLIHRTCSVNCSSTPVNVSIESSNVNQDSFTRNQTYIVEETKTADQQSNTNLANSIATSDIQIYPTSPGTTSALPKCVVKNPTSINQGADIAERQTKPFTHLTVYNLQKSLAMQNRVPTQVHRVPITPGAGSVLGSVSLYK